MSTQTDSAGAKWWLPVALVLLPVLAFAPGLTSPLTHYDDPLYLDRPEFAAGWKGLAALWTGRSAWSGHFIEFFPLRDTIYWVLFQQWEKTPLPYHLVSLAIHVAATLLAFRFVLALGQTRWVAAAVALLFAVHPIHIESVVWAAGLKDPLYTCFLLGSLLAYLKYRERGRPSDYAWSMGLLVCGLLVKSMMLSTPLLMIALERFVGTPTSWKTIVRRLLGPAAICALFLAQFIEIGRLNSVRTTLHQGNLEAHVVLVGWAQVLYLRQLFFPASFRLIYCFAPVESLLDPRFFAALGLLVAVAVALVASRRHPIRLFCLSFYFACLLPVSNLLPFPAVMADRYLYAASLAGLLLLATLLERARPLLRNTLLGALVAGLTLTCALRAAAWQDEESLWQEPDEDPVCMEDPEFPAADVHFLRYVTARDNQTRVEALGRIVARRHSFGLRCEALVEGAPLLEQMGDHTTADQWMRLAMAECQARPRQLARATLLVSLHHDLPLAVDAAERWHQLTPSPATDLLRQLTRLEFIGPPAPPELLPLVKSNPAETCGLLAQWVSEVSPSMRAAVAEAMSSCGSRR